MKTLEDRIRVARAALDLADAVRSGTVRGLTTVE
jgi:hypothetical protein